MRILKKLLGCLVILALGFLIGAAIALHMPGKPFLGPIFFLLDAIGCLLAMAWLCRSQTVFRNARKKREKKPARLGLRFKKTSKGRISLEDLLDRFADRPFEFEQYVADMYSRMGYRTQVTPSSNDGGVDIVMQKDTIHYIVEVKLYGPDHKVGREKLQKLYAAYHETHANKAIFVTTSVFTSTAAEYAKAYNIDLVDGDKLVDMLNSLAGSGGEARI